MPELFTLHEARAYYSARLPDLAQRGDERRESFAVDRFAGAAT